MQVPRRPHCFPVQLFINFIIEEKMRFYCSKNEKFFQLGLGDIHILIIHLEIFKPLSHCFEETIEFDVKALFASRPLSSLIR